MRFQQWMRPAFLLFSAASPVFLHAQFQPVSQEELKMTSDPKAPGAAAVYLDIEDVTDDELHSRTFYARIKVLQGTGKEVAAVEVPNLGRGGTGQEFLTMKLPYQDTTMSLSQPSVVSGSGASITDFKARIIHADGTIVPLEGKTADLLKLEATEQHTLRAVVHLPGVEVGSIVEYRYVERYEGLYTSPHWEVQRNYFVQKAHFAFMPYKSFRTGPENQVGSYLIDRHGVALNFLLYWLQLPPGAALTRDGAGRFLLDVKDVAASPQDEWMPPNNSLHYGVRFYYRSDADAKGFWVKETKRWSKDVDRLAEPTKTIRDAVAGLVVSGDSELEKARRLYKAVQAFDNTDFSRAKSQSSAQAVAQAAQRPDDTWTRKSGSSQDIAMLFLSMARAAGLTAWDMKVVNRDRGAFTPEYLYFDQLDDDIILIAINGKDIMLDPGQKMCPFQVVHWKHSGAGGIRESADGRSIVTSPQQPYSANTILRMGDIHVDDHGSALGTFRFVMTGQEALRWRQAALENDDTEVKKEFDQSLATIAPQGMEAHVDRFEGLGDPESNLVAIVNMRGSFAATAGKGLQLPCFFFETRDHEPFVDEAHRATPVDMHYGEQITEQVTYHVPANMQIEGAPQDVRIPWGEQAIFAVKTKADPHQVTIARSLARGFTLAKPEEYENLRSFYLKIALADQQSLVLAPANSTGGN
jgi:hypothetical protein